MKLTKALLILAMSLALPNFGYSHGNGHNERPIKNQVITLDQSDVHDLNSTGVLRLRKALKNVTTINQNSKLVQVTVTGFARGNMSLLSLKIDGNEVDSAYMERQRRRRSQGHRTDRNDRRRPQLSTVILKNTSRSNQGKWKLSTDQDVKVRSITVTLKKARRGDGHRHSQIKLGSFKVDKFVGDSKTLRINETGVESITLKALSNSANIRSVTVKYSNGQTERLHRLEGKIRENGSVTASLSRQRNRTVRSINIKATSRNLHGSRAKIVVYADINDNNDGRRPRRRH